MEFEIDDALKLADESYQVRLRKHRMRRQRLYYNDKEASTTSEMPSSDWIDSTSLINNAFSPMEMAEHISNGSDEEIVSVTNYSDEETLSDSSIEDFRYENDSSDVINFDPMEDLDEIVDSNSMIETINRFSSSDLLHDYTIMSNDVFCNRLLQLFRSSKLSKSEHQKFLDLIRSGLPNPNNLPSNMRSLLKTVQMDESLFTKRTVCSICEKDIIDKSSICSTCPDSNKTNLVNIYESNIHRIICVLLKRFWSSIFVGTSGDQTDNPVIQANDIHCGEAYRFLFNKFSNEKFVTGLAHLDGISLCKSSKLKMWLFSLSIVELPARIRYKRYNMPVISMWIGYREPVASVWLRNSVLTLNQLKVSGN